MKLPLEGVLLAVFVQSALSDADKDNYDSEVSVPIAGAPEYLPYLMTVLGILGMVSFFAAAYHCCQVQKIRQKRLQSLLNPDKGEPGVLAHKIATHFNGVLYSDNKCNELLQFTHRLHSILEEMPGAQAINQDIILSAIKAYSLTHKHVYFSLMDWSFDELIKLVTDIVKHSTNLDLERGANHYGLLTNHGLAEIQDFKPEDIAACLNHFTRFNITTIQGADEESHLSRDNAAVSQIQISLNNLVNKIKESLQDLPKWCYIATISWLDDKLGNLVIADDSDVSMIFTMAEKRLQAIQNLTSTQEKKAHIRKKYIENACLAPEILAVEMPNKSMPVDVLMQQLGFKVGSYTATQLKSVLTALDLIDRSQAIKPAFFTLFHQLKESVVNKKIATLVDRVGMRGPATNEAKADQGGFACHTTRHNKVAASR